MPNLKNLEKEIAINYYKKGLELFEKQKVREIDEEGSGNFIAFVDEGKESYDVQIKVDLKSFDIIENNCDCKENTPFCQHKVAVSLQIAKKGTKKTKVIAQKLKVKKKSEVEKLMDEIPEIELRNWLLELFSNDKMFQAKFKQRFKEDNVELSIEALQSQTNSLAKIELGNKKYIQLTSLTKILDLWRPYHNNVLKLIMPEIYLENNFNIFNSLLNLLYIYQSNLDSSTNKLEKYINEKFNLFQTNFDQLSNENKEILINLICNKLINLYSRIEYINLLINYLKTNNPINYKEILTKIFQVTTKLYNIDNATNLNILKFIIDKGEFNNYYSFVKLIPYFDEYNALILKELDNQQMYREGINFGEKFLNNYGYTLSNNKFIYDYLLKFSQNTNKSDKIDYYTKYIKKFFNR